MTSVSNELQQPEHIGQIDALRGIAAFLVAFVFHAHHVLGDPRTGPLDGLPVFTWLHDYGWTLVDLFFIISGFVFSHVYLIGGELKKGVTARSFLVARIARLYPLHILTFLIVAPTLALGYGSAEALSNFDFKHSILNILMLQESGLNDGFSFNVPAWSISVEVFCYIAFLICVLIGRTALSRFAIFVVAFGVVVTISTNASVDHIARGFVGFFVGYFIWTLRDRQIPVLPLVLLSVIPFFFKPDGISYGVFLSLTAWPAILLLSLRTSLLLTVPFKWIGDRSYSIYLLHSPIYIWVSILVFGGEMLPQSIWIVVNLACMVVILAASDISYRYFETPLRRNISKRFSG